MIPIGEIRAKNPTMLAANDAAALNETF